MERDLTRAGQGGLAGLDGILGKSSSCESGERWDGIHREVVDALESLEGDPGWTGLGGP